MNEIARPRQFKPIDPVTAIALPALDPGQGRLAFSLDEGATVADAVAAAFPGLPHDQRPRVRVTLVDADGRTAVLYEACWHAVRPRAGVRIVIRLVPAGGGNFLRSVLTAVVAIAAVAAGAFFAPAVAGFLGINQGLAQGLVTAGVGLGGRALVNALIPVRGSSGGDDAEPAFSIDGLRNQVRLDGVVPAVTGGVRYIPPVAGRPFTEIVGDDQYFRTVLNFGYGRCAVSAIKIGDTPIDEYKDVEYEVREGLASDAPLSLYTHQVIEERTGVDLTRPLPRDDKGEVIDGPAEETPETRFTAADVAEIAVIIGFLEGLVRYNKKNKRKTLSVEIKIETRPVGDTTWTEVETLTFAARKQRPFFRVYRWTPPARGRYEVRLTRMTDERNDNSSQDRSTWVALQSIRPEYPLQFEHPLCLVAIRIRATNQINGVIDNVSAFVERYCPDWDAASQTWIERPTNNPASLYRWALQGPAAPHPVTDAEIDLAALADWHDYCVMKGLKYSRAHDFGASWFEALADVAAAGRATPHHDGTVWSTVIDRPQQIVIDHVNERNASNFAFRRRYFEPPDAFRVSFLDETNEYKANERVVPWPGHVGDILLAEDLALPGKTDPDEIWIEARRRMYEAIHRPDQFTCSQNGSIRVATRGDLVRVSHSVLSDVQASRRVRAVRNGVVVLSEPVEMTSDDAYGIRFMVLNDDGSGTSVLRGVKSASGIQGSLVPLDVGALPMDGDIVHFGPMTEESEPMIVRGVEAGEDMTSTLALVAAADVIDTLTDAETPPLWDGRVGDPVQDSTAPTRPVITGAETTADHDGVALLLSPGKGSSAVVATFTVRHRLDGATEWAEIIVPAGALATLTGYAEEDAVDIEVFATSIAGIDGPVLATTATVDATDRPAPVEDATVQLVDGSAELSFRTPNEDDVDRAIIHRAARRRFDEAAAAKTVFASASQAVVERDDATPGGTSFYWVTAVDVLDVESVEVFAGFVTKNSQNLVSTDLTTWTATAMIVTPDIAEGWLTGPSGAAKIIPSATGSTHSLVESFIAAGGTDYVLSVIAKGDEIDSGIRVYFAGAGFDDDPRGRTFDLTDGTSSAYSGGSDAHGSTDLGDGYWLIWIHVSVDAAGSADAVIEWGGTGNATDGFIVDHVQVEAGVTAPSGTYWLNAV